MSQEYVILVDNDDQEIGICEKLEAHRKALLHRAISVFIVNSKGEWLLQQRALNKYHSNGLWTNSCCSHPYPGESNLDAAHRRLKEEMGIVCSLKELFSFTYQEALDRDLTEHELDHVFVGYTDLDPIINTDEVRDWKWIGYDSLLSDLNAHQDSYTVWFRHLVSRVADHLSR